MIIKEIIEILEIQAPPILQETYDNIGLITGVNSQKCTGVLCTLDATESVIEEAIQQNCNLIVAHHPIIFGGLKKINGHNYVERAIIKAIKHDIAIYAIHTNLDNIINGVNGKIADLLGLINRQILQPKQQMLCKIVTFVPMEHAEKIKHSFFESGAGQIGLYSECSFSIEGTGTFKAGVGASPFVGIIGKREEVREAKVEVVCPVWRKDKVLRALIEAHPYESVAYDIIKLENTENEIGSGLIGMLPKPVNTKEFFETIKQTFGLSVIKHTNIISETIQSVAICGGAGSFLTSKAIARRADIFLSADFKYHEFFDADDKIIIADIGHWESEHFTIDLLVDILKANFPTFAIQKSKSRTNPVYYFA